MDEEQQQRVSLVVPVYFRKQFVACDDERHRLIVGTGKHHIEILAKAAVEPCYPHALLPGGSAQPVERVYLYLP